MRALSPLITMRRSLWAPARRCVSLSCQAQHSHPDQPSEDDMAKASTEKAAAMEAQGNGNYEQAVRYEATNTQGAS